MTVRMKGVKSTGAIGALIVVFTIIAFFLLNIERDALHIWALSFLLLAEVALFSGLILIRFAGGGHSPVFLRSGVTTTLILYLAVTFASMLTVPWFKEHLNRFILMQLLFIVAATVIVIAMLMFSRKISDDDSQVIAARSFMNGCESRVHALLSDAKNAEYKQPLNALYESIKYADKIGSSTLDGQIDAALGNLEAALGGGHDGASNAFDEITSLIKRRKTEISESKRGGF